MEDEQLQELVENISIQYFGKSFQHQAIFNSRLKTTGGRYHLISHHLDFNRKILEEFGLDIFIGIIKHELCHYHLHLENKGFRHKDADFKSLLKKVNGLRFTPSIEMKQTYLERWKYVCSKCQVVVYRKNRFNINKYVCKNCKSIFIFKGKEVIKKKE